MLDTLKKMLGKSIQETGLLTIQNEPFQNTSLKLENNKLIFSGFTDQILIDEILELELENDTLKFIFDHKKYKFKSNSSKDIYLKINPLIPNRSIFKSGNISYYTYNNDARKFELHDLPCIANIISNDGYYLYIEDESSITHFEQINTGTQYYLDKSNHSFVWSIYKHNVFHTFCLEFSDHINFLEFSSKYTESCYRSVNEGDEFKYFENMAFINTVDANNNNDANNITENINSNVNNSSENVDDNWDEYDQEVPEKSEFNDNNNNNTNENLIIGNNIAFVTRGSSLGVFDLEQNDLKFRTHVQNVFNSPEKIITHNQNQSLLVLDKDQKDKLQVLDLNKGQVIEKWDINENMNDYFDGVKHNNEGTLVGVTDYSLFRIDPRMKDKVAEKNTYKTKNEFSCGIATVSGDVAVASKKGDLRLYNKIDKRAKSLLPGFGDEILGIDSSKDGSMILCTCKNYLLVFLATADYSKPLGKDKPTPIRLQLKPQHLSLIKDQISFIPAKFDQDDSMIVTGTGRFVIKWRIADVKGGRLYDYSLKALYDIIVDENFIFKGEDVIVALPNDVKKVTEDELRKPK